MTSQNAHAHTLLNQIPNPVILLHNILEQFQVIRENTVYNPQYCTHDPIALTL